MLLKKGEERHALWRAFDALKLYYQNM